MGGVTVLSHVTDAMTQCSFHAPDPAELAEKARQGDVAAYGELVRATQAEVYAVVRRVMADREEARDAVQEVYLRAFRRLGTLRAAGAFDAWLRRIAVTTAIEMARRRRTTFLADPQVLSVPVLDEEETRWTEAQRQALARALLTLRPTDRRLCDRYYYGRASAPALAREDGCSEAAMRKRLQRIRDQLRKEIQMIERRNTAGESLPEDLPQKIVELLAHPMLTDVPENPVGQTWQAMRGLLAGFTEVELSEVVCRKDVLELVGQEHMRDQPGYIHRINDEQYLRHDLTLPLLLSARRRSGPQRLTTCGKTYRNGKQDRMHLEAFHQAEVFMLGPGVEVAHLTGLVMHLLDELLGGHPYRVERMESPMIWDQGWCASVNYADGEWDMAAWGRFTPAILRSLGRDPNVEQGGSAGFGLERLASIRYGIMDLRAIEAARVAP